MHDGGAILDPGTDDYKLLRAIEDCRANISSILLTHGHKNHSASVMEILRNFGSIPIYVAEAEKPLLDKALTSGQVIGDEVLVRIASHLDRSPLREGPGDDRCCRS